QACEKNRLSFDSRPSTAEGPRQEIGGGSGHGSGYDGKPNPGLYVKEDKGQTCDLGGGQSTHVVAMIRVDVKGPINYYSTCREESPTSLNESDIKVLSENELEYLGSLFGLVDVLPVIPVEPPPPIPPPNPVRIGGCQFFSLEEPNQEGALINIFVDIYKDQGTGAITSRVVIDEIRGGSMQETRFLPQGAMIEYLPNNSAYVDSRSPSYDLEVMNHDRTRGDADVRFHLGSSPYGIGTFRPGACDL
ncbi:MAG: hypothetical protein KDD43_11900, partial [Bdellovibrionales bacterium]|nr:hypothetical protein [Bdellovibrionales bacterium]